MCFDTDEAKAVAMYDKLERVLNRCAEEAGIKDLERYYIPLCQQGGDGSGVSKGSPVKSHKISESKMMEQFARSLQNSPQMANLIKFDKEEDVDGVIQHPMRDAIAKATSRFSPETIVASGKDAVGCKEYDGLYKTLFYIIYGVDWGKDVEKAEADLTNDKPTTNLRKYARGLYEAAQFLTDDSKYDGGLTNFELINQAVCQGCSDRRTPVMKNALEIFFAKKEGKRVIPGLGPALACDFLKECGCLWLSKPDRHLLKVLAKNEVFKDCKLPADIKGLTEATALKFSKLMCDFAKAVRDKKGDDSITPYRIDKMIWLLCAGNFYLEKDKKPTISRDMLVGALLQP